MTIFSESGLWESRRPLVKARGLAFEQLVSIQSVTSDLRWAMVELAWRLLTTMCVLALARVALWARQFRAPRPGQGGGEHCCC